MAELVKDNKAQSRASEVDSQSKATHSLENPPKKNSENALSQEDSSSGVSEEEKERIKKLEVDLRDILKANLQGEALKSRLAEVLPQIKEEHRVLAFSQFELEELFSSHKKATEVLVSRMEYDGAEILLGRKLSESYEGESPLHRRARESQVKELEAKEKSFHERYPEAFDKEQLSSIIQDQRNLILSERYLEQTRGKKTWEERSEVLRSHGVFESLNEEKLRKFEYQKEHQLLIGELGKASYEKGLYLEPAQKGHPEYQSKFQAAKTKVNSLRERLENHLDTAPESEKLSSEKHEELLLSLAENEIKGLSAYGKYRDEEKKEALAQQEKEKHEGGAVYAAKEVLINARDSVPKIIESVGLLTAGNTRQGVGFWKGVFKLENPFRTARDEGVAYIESSRKLFNEKAWGGSLLGSDEEFAKLSLPEAGLRMSPLAHVGGALVSPLLELADVGRVQLGRLSYKVGGSNISYQDFLEMETNDHGLLKAGKVAFQIGQTAAALALMRPESVGAVAQSLTVAGGMGAAGAISQELMMDGEIDLGRLMENTIHGTAGSTLFMGGMSVFGRSYVTLRSGSGIRGKIASGEKLLEGEVELLSRVSKESQLLRNGIDFFDAQKDFNHALVQLSEVIESGSTETKPGQKNFYLRLLGASIGVGVSTVDGFDVSLGGGTYIRNKVDQLMESGVVSRTVQGMSNALEGTNLPFMNEKQRGEGIVSENGNIRYFDSIESLQARYVSERVAFLEQNGVDSESANTQAEIEKRSVTTFYSKEEGRTISLNPLSRAGMGEASVEELMGSALVIGEMGRVALEENSGVSGVEAEIQALELSDMYLRQHGHAMVFEGGTYRVVEAGEGIAKAERSEIEQFVKSKGEVTSSSSISVAIETISGLEFSSSDKTTETAFRKDVALKTLKVGDQEFLGYFSGNSKVFFLENHNEVGKLFEAISTEAKENISSKGVSAFFDKESGITFSEKPQIKTGEKSEGIKYTSVLSHELAHGKGKREIEAYEKQAEYLLKNGLEMVFSEDKGSWRVEELSPERREVLKREPQTAIETALKERYFVEKREDIEAFLENNYSEAEVDGVSRLAAAKEGVESDGVPQKDISTLIEVIKQEGNRRERRKAVAAVVESLPVLDGETALVLIENGYHDLLIERLDNIQGLNSEVALKMIEAGQAWFVSWHLEIFEGLNHLDIALQMIEEGQAGSVAGYIEKFEGLNSVVATKLIEAGQATFVSWHIEKFEGLNYNNIAQKMIEAGQADAVAGYLEIFQGLNSEVALKLVEAGQATFVSWHIENFQGLNSEVAFKLIEVGQAYAVAKNLKNFEGLNHLDIALKMIETGQALFVFWHIEKFEGLNYNNIAQKMIEAGQAYAVARNLGNFDGLNSGVAVKLIEAGRANAVARNLGNFDGLNSGVAVKLIEAGEAYAVAKNLKNFEGLSHLDTALKIIEAGRADAVARNLGNFDGLNSGVAVKLIEAGEADTVARNLGKFGSLNLEVALSFIKAGEIEYARDNKQYFRLDESFCETLFNFALADKEFKNAIPKDLVKINDEQLDTHLSEVENTTIEEYTRIYNVFGCHEYFSKVLEKIDANSPVEEQRKAIFILTNIALSPKTEEKKKTELIDEILVFAKQELTDDIAESLSRISSTTNSVLVSAKKEFSDLIRAKEERALTLKEEIYLSVLLASQQADTAKFLLQFLTLNSLAEGRKEKILYNFLSEKKLFKTKDLTKLLSSEFLDNGQNRNWSDFLFFHEAFQISNTQIRGAALFQLEKVITSRDTFDLEDFRLGKYSNIPRTAFPALMLITGSSERKLKVFNELYAKSKSTSERNNFLTAITEFNGSSNIATDLAMNILFGEATTDSVKGAEFQRKEELENIKLNQVQSTELSQIESLFRAISAAKNFGVLNRDLVNTLENKELNSATEILRTENTKAIARRLRIEGDVDNAHFEALTRHWGDLEPLFTYASQHSDDILSYLGTLVTHMDAPNYQGWKKFKYKLESDGRSKSLKFLSKDQLAHWTKNNFVELSDMKLQISKGDTGEVVFKELVTAINGHHHLKDSHPELQDRFSKYLRELEIITDFDSKRAKIFEQISEVNTLRTEIAQYLRGIEADEIPKVLNKQFQTGSEITVNAKTKAGLDRLSKFLSEESAKKVADLYLIAETKFKNQKIKTDSILTPELRAEILKELVLVKADSDKLDKERLFKEFGISKDEKAPIRILGPRSNELEALSYLLRLSSLSKAEVAKGSFIEDKTQKSGLKLIDAITKVERLLKFEKVQSAFKQDLSNIAFQLNHQDTSDLDRERRLAVIFTDDPQILMQVGKYPLNCGSCQNYDHGSYNESLLGYVGDPHTKALMLVDIDKLPSELVARINEDGFDQVRDQIPVQEILDASIARSIAKVVGVKRSKKSKSNKEYRPGIFLEPTYSTINKGDLGMDKYFNMLTQLVVADQMGVRLLRGGGNKRVRVPGSLNPGGQYEDCGAGNAGHGGMGILDGSYSMPARYVQGFDRPTEADRRLAARVSEASFEEELIQAALSPIVDDSGGAVFESQRKVLQEVERNERLERIQSRPNTNGKLISENQPATNTLTRSNIPLVNLKINNQTFKGYFGKEASSNSDSNVFYLSSIEDLRRLHQELSREKGANTESSGVGAFYDRDTKTYYAVQPTSGESRMQTIERASLLVHERAHFKDKASESEAYLKQVEYLLDNGFEMVFSPNGMSWRPQELSAEQVDALKKDLENSKENPRRDEYLRNKESDINAFIDNNYSEAEIDGASRLAAARNGTFAEEISTQDKNSSNDEITERINEIDNFLKQTSYRFLVEGKIDSENIIKEVKEYILKSRRELSKIASSSELSDGSINFEGIANKIIESCDQLRFYIPLLYDVSSNPGDTPQFLNTKAVTDNLSLLSDGLNAMQSMKDNLIRKKKRDHDERIRFIKIRAESDSADNKNKAKNENSEKVEKKDSSDFVDKKVTPDDLGVGLGGRIVVGTIMSETQAGLSSRGLFASKQEVILENLQRVPLYELASEKDWHSVERTEGPADLVIEWSPGTGRKITLPIRDGLQIISVDATLMNGQTVPLNVQEVNNEYLIDNKSEYDKLRISYQTRDSSSQQNKDLAENISSIIPPQIYADDKTDLQLHQILRINDTAQRADAIVSFMTSSDLKYVSESSYYHLLAMLPEESRISFILGARMGDCKALNGLLEVLLRTAEVPAYSKSGPVKDSKSNDFISPGHRQVVALLGGYPITLDATLWTVSNYKNRSEESALFDEFYSEAIDLQPEQAFEFGEQVRAYFDTLDLKSNDELSNNSEGGHTLADDRKLLEGLKGSTALDRTKTIYEEEVRQNLKDLSQIYLRLVDNSKSVDSNEMLKLSFRNESFAEAYSNYIKHLFDPSFEIEALEMELGKLIFTILYDDTELAMTPSAEILRQAVYDQLEDSFHSDGSSLKDQFNVLSSRYRFKQLDMMLHGFNRPRKYISNVNNNQSILEQNSEEINELKIQYFSKVCEVFLEAEELGYLKENKSYYTNFIYEEFRILTQELVRAGNCNEINDPNILKVIDSYAKGKLFDAIFSLDFYDDQSLISTPAFFKTDFSKEDSDKFLSELTNCINNNPDVLEKGRRLLVYLNEVHAMAGKIGKINPSLEAKAAFFNSPGFQELLKKSAPLFVKDSAGESLLEHALSSTNDYKVPLIALFIRMGIVDISEIRNLLNTSQVSVPAFVVKVKIQGICIYLNDGTSLFGLSFASVDNLEFAPSFELASALFASQADIGVNCKFSHVLREMHEAGLFAKDTVEQKKFLKFLDTFNKGIISGEIKIDESLHSISLSEDSFIRIIEDYCPEVFAAIKSHNIIEYYKDLLRQENIPSTDKELIEKSLDAYRYTVINPFFVDIQKQLEATNISFVLPAFSANFNHTFSELTKANSRKLGMVKMLRTDDLISNEELQWDVDSFRQRVRRITQGRGGMVRGDEVSGRRISASKTNEFHDLRPYAPGDDVRMINQRISGRSGNLMVNRFKETQKGIGKKVDLIVDIDLFKQSVRWDIDQEHCKSLLINIMCDAASHLANGKQVQISFQQAGDSFYRIPTEELRKFFGDAQRANPISAGMVRSKLDEIFNHVNDSFRIELLLTRLYYPVRESENIVSDYRDVLPRNRSRDDRTVFCYVSNSNRDQTLQFLHRAGVDARAVSLDRRLQSAIAPEAVFGENTQDPRSETNPETTKTLSRNNVALVDHKINDQTFKGYYGKVASTASDSNVFYLTSIEDVRRLHQELSREKGANTESSGVAAFFDRDTKTYYAVQAMPGESRMQTIARASLLVHERSHFKDKASESEAYLKQVEYLLDNGFEMVFSSNGMSWRPQELSAEQVDALKKDLENSKENPRRDKYLRNKESDISAFIDNNYSEAEIDGASRLAAVRKPLDYNTPEFLSSRAYRQLLSLWGIPLDFNAINTPDGIALLANLANNSAKVHNGGWYYFKEELCEWLVNNHRKAFYSEEENCLYVDTTMGQVSFHLPNIVDYQEELNFTTGGNPEFSGIPLQSDASFVLDSYIRIFNNDLDAEINYDKWINGLRPLAEDFKASESETIYEQESEVEDLVSNDFIGSGLSSVIHPLRTYKPQISSANGFTSIVDSGVREFYNIINLYHAVESEIRSRDDVETFVKDRFGRQSRDLLKRKVDEVEQVFRSEVEQFLEDTYVAQFDNIKEIGGLVSAYNEIISSLSKEKEKFNLDRIQSNQNDERDASPLISNIVSQKIDHHIDQITTQLRNNLLGRMNSFDSVFATKEGHYFINHYGSTIFLPLAKSNQETLEVYDKCILVSKEDARKLANQKGEVSIKSADLSLDTVPVVIKGMRSIKENDGMITLDKSAKGIEVSIGNVVSNSYRWKGQEVLSHEYDTTLEEDSSESALEKLDVDRRTFMSLAGILSGSTLLTQNNDLRDDYSESKSKEDRSKEGRSQNSKVKDSTVDKRNQKPKDSNEVQKSEDYSDADPRSVIVGSAIAGVFLATAKEITKKILKEYGFDVTALMEHKSQQIFIEQLKAKPIETIFTTNFVAPLTEEYLFRLIPSLLADMNGKTGLALDVGIPANLLFTLMHNITKDPDKKGFAGYKLDTEHFSLPTFFSGLFFWYMQREYGFSAALASHFTNNATHQTMNVYRILSGALNNSETNSTPIESIQPSNFRESKISSKDDSAQKEIRSDKIIYFNNIEDLRTHYRDLNGTMLSDTVRAFYDPITKKIASVLPEALRRRDSDTVEARDRAKDIIDASFIIHERDHQRSAQQKSEFTDLERFDLEVSAYILQAQYLRDRGFRMNFRDASYTIEQIAERENADARVRSIRRGEESTSNDYRFKIDVDAIRNFVANVYDLKSFDRQNRMRGSAVESLIESSKWLMNLEVGEEYNLGRSHQDGQAGDLHYGKVSRIHAVIRRIENDRSGMPRFTIEDLGSTHGTFVNGVKINKGEVVKLKPLDSLYLASTKYRIWDKKESNDFIDRTEPPIGIMDTINNDYYKNQNNPHLLIRDKEVIEILHRASRKEDVEKIVGDNYIFRPASEIQLKIGKLNEVPYKEISYQGLSTTIIQQQGLNSSAYASSLMLALDLINNNQEIAYDKKALADLAEDVRLGQDTQRIDSRLRSIEHLKRIFPEQKESIRVSNSSSIPFLVKQQIDEGTPLIIKVRSENRSHYIVVDAIDNRNPEAVTATIRDPWHGWQIVVPWNRLIQMWGDDREYMQINNYDESFVRHDPFAVLQTE